MHKNPTSSILFQKITSRLQKVLTKSSLHIGKTCYNSLWRPSIDVHSVKKKKKKMVPRRRRCRHQLYKILQNLWQRDVAQCWLISLRNKNIFFLFQVPIDGKFTLMSINENIIYNLIYILSQVKKTFVIIIIRVLMKSHCKP